MELFQWLSKKESIKAMSSGKLRKNAIDEVADVFIYLIAFAMRMILILNKRLIRK